MASGPYFDDRRGTWSVQWFDGLKWRRKVVVKKPRGWKPGKAAPKKPPPEAFAALVEYTAKEEAARSRRSLATEQTVETFLSTYRQTFAGSHEEGSTRELGKAIRLFLTWCESASVRRVSEVTPAVCNRWIADRAATVVSQTRKPVQYATLVKERSLLATAWEGAANRQELDANPWANAPVPGKPAKKTRGSWSPEEFTRLFAVSRPWLRDLLTLGCHTGLRITALRLLEWRDITWASAAETGFGWVIVRSELDKTGVGYRVPMSRECHDLLARRFVHRDAHATIVLTADRGGPINSRSVTDRAIRMACARAGLREPDSPNHHMRRSFGRWGVLGHLTGKPVPLYVVSRWLGHATVATTLRYLDIREDDSTRFMMGTDDESAPGSVVN